MKSLIFQCDSCQKEYLLSKGPLKSEALDAEHTREGDAQFAKRDLERLDEFVDGLQAHAKDCQGKVVYRATRMVD